MDNPPVLFTIGHSTHPLDKFIGLLQAHRIATLCDVRSAPYSRLHPQFNREPLRETLVRHRIGYVYLGRELGARSDDPACYREGKVQYDLLAGTPLFKSGIVQLQANMTGARTAIMCAEKDPLECHRTILVAQAVSALGVEVQHILEDGRLESHADALARLLKQLRMPEQELFRTEQEILADACRIQADRIAYTESAPSPGMAPAGDADA